MASALPSPPSASLPPPGSHTWPCAPRARTLPGQAGGDVSGPLEGDGDSGLAMTSSSPSSSGGCQEAGVASRPPGMTWPGRDGGGNALSRVCCTSPQWAKDATSPARTAASSSAGPRTALSCANPVTWGLGAIPRAAEPKQSQASTVIPGHLHCRVAVYRLVVSNSTHNSRLLLGGKAPIPGTARFVRCARDLPVLNPHPAARNLPAPPSTPLCRTVETQTGDDVSRYPNGKGSDPQLAPSPAECSGSLGKLSWGGGLGEGSKARSA